MSFFRTIFRPNVTSQREVNRYVVTVTAFVLACFLAIDIPNHLLYYTRWSDYLRDFSIDIVMGVALSVPVLRSVGGAHLALHVSKREAERLSRVDPLTGLANRRALYDAAEKLQNAPIALVIADIDRFKRINDKYGHDGGDKVIQFVANALSEQLADLGTVARMGGEEFALVGAHCPRSEIHLRLQLVRDRLAKTPVMADGEPVFVSLSFGVAVGEGAGFQNLYIAADKALYVAKASGRDRVVDFDEIKEIATDQPASLRKAG